MTQVSDNFVRANGALGSNWQTPIPNYNEFLPNTTPAGGLLINGNGYGPINASGGDCAALWAGGQSFANDQFAAARVNSVAAPTAVLSITAAIKSGGNVTYTYTVTGGSVASPISGGALYVVISGMQNAGNNGAFTPTTFGAGTFTVANASGITEAGSTGIGTCPSDSGAGVMVRCSGTSIATLNGYHFHVGTNSFSGDGRVAYYELWKIVNGVGTLLAGPGADTVLPVPGDTLAISVVGTTVKAYYNGAVRYTVTDSSLSSGTVGITSFSLAGPTEYVFADWSTPGNAFTGNNGTTLNNFQAGDFSFTEMQLASDALLEGVVSTLLKSDSFAYANGDLHAANANWAYEGTSTFKVSGNKVFSSQAGVINSAYRSDASPTNDQYSEIVAVVNTGIATQNCGPAVRVSASAATFYAIQYASDALKIAKDVAGVFTVLATAGSGFPVTGDVLRLQVVGSYLTVFKNGVPVAGLTNIFDSSIASGNVGIFCTGNATLNGFSSWNGGNVQGFPSQFTTNTGLFYSDTVAGGYAAAFVSAFAAAYQNNVAWPNDQYAQVTMSGASIAANQQIGPAVRVSSGAVTWYQFAPQSSGTVNLVKVVAGVASTIASAPYTFVQGDVFRLEVQGILLVGRINGVISVFGFDASIASGSPGIAGETVAGNPATPSGTIKSFSAGNSITSPPVTSTGSGDMDFSYRFGF